jgi:hypothetical protein
MSPRSQKPRPLGHQFGLLSGQARILRRSGAKEVLVLNTGLIPAKLHSMGLTEIILVATLHQMHSQVQGYGFQELGNVTTKLKPAVLVADFSLLKSLNIQKLKLEDRKLSTMKRFCLLRTS